MSLLRLIHLFALGKARGPTIFRTRPWIALRMTHRTQIGKDYYIPCLVFKYFLMLSFSFLITLFFFKIVSKLLTLTVFRSEVSLEHRVIFISLTQGFFVFLEGTFSIILLFIVETLFNL